MFMTLKNIEIYNYANSLGENFIDNTLSLPIKANFYLQKNIKELLELAQDIERERIEIAKKYGTPSEDGGQYEVPPENIHLAQKELEDLFNLTQEVKIYPIDLDAFGDAELTAAQMKALLFMIKEEDEEDNDE